MAVHEEGGILHLRHFLLKYFASKVLTKKYEIFFDKFLKNQSKEESKILTRSICMKPKVCSINCDGKLSFYSNGSIYVTDKLASVKPWLLYHG